MRVLTCPRLLQSEPVFLKMWLLQPDRRAPLLRPPTRLLLLLLRLLPLLPNPPAPLCPKHLLRSAHSRSPISFGSSILAKMTALWLLLPSIPRLLRLLDPRIEFLPTLNADWVTLPPRSKSLQPEP